MVPSSWFVVAMAVAAVAVTATIAREGQQGVNDATSLLAAIVIVARERPGC